MTANITAEAEVFIDAIKQGLDTTQKITNSLGLEYNSVHAAVRRLHKKGLVNAIDIRNKGAYSIHKQYSLTGKPYEICQRKMRNVYTKEQPKYKEDTYSQLDDYLYPKMK